jgi:hypothetical protein
MNRIEEKKYIHQGTAIVTFMLLMYVLFSVLPVILGATISELLYPYLFITAGLLFGLLCVYNITITIGSTYLSIKLGIGLIKKRYEIAKIKSCKPIVSRRIGSGSKTSFTGARLEYYIVTGSKAIELEFHDRKNTTVQIGTPLSEEISQYVQSLIDT